MRTFQAWVGSPENSAPYALNVDSPTNAIKSVHRLMSEYGDKIFDPSNSGGVHIVLHDLEPDGWWYAAVVGPYIGAWDEFVTASTSLRGLGLPL